jgi:hypothetical protein
MERGLGWNFPSIWNPDICVCILACTNICATTSVPIFTVLTLFFRFFLDNHSANRSSIYFSSFVTDICQKGELKSMNCCLFLWREAWDGISLLFGTRIYVSVHPDMHKNLRHHLCSYVHCFNSSFSFFLRQSFGKLFVYIPFNIWDSETVQWESSWTLVEQNHHHHLL